MTGDVETFEDKVEAERRRRAKYFFIIPGKVLFSEAFHRIARRGPTVTVFLMVLSRQPLPPRAKDRKRLEKAGLWPPTPTPFSFAAREARAHGLTEKGLLQGLRRLHEVGLIDRIKSGSARKADFARYQLSERWRSYGTPGFKVLDWPAATMIGKRGEGGKFVRRRSGKHPARQSSVVAETATIKAPLMAKTATTRTPVVAESAMNEALRATSVVAENAMFLLSPSIPDKKRKKESKDGRELRTRAATPEEVAGVVSWT